MKYYIPVGAGGVFFRIGMLVTRLLGSWVYWRASRRRARMQPDDPALGLDIFRQVLPRLETCAVPNRVSRAPATRSFIEKV
jgi:hypothetical protein